MHLVPVQVLVQWTDSVAEVVDERASGGAVGGTSRG